MNKLYNQLQRSPAKSSFQSNNLGQVRNMMKTLKFVKNPMSALQNNPQMKQVFDLVQQGGGDPKVTFYSMAEQMGVNPDDVLSALR